MADQKFAIHIGNLHIRLVSTSSIPEPCYRICCDAIEGGEVVIAGYPVVDIIKSAEKFYWEILDFDLLSRQMDYLFKNCDYILKRTSNIKYDRHIQLMTYQHGFGTLTKWKCSACKDYSSSITTYGGDYVCNKCRDKRNAVGVISL